MGGKGAARRDSGITRSVHLSRRADILRRRETHTTQVAVTGEEMEGRPGMGEAHDVPLE